MRFGGIAFFYRHIKNYLRGFKILLNQLYFYIMKKISFYFVILLFLCANQVYGGSSAPQLNSGNLQKRTGNYLRNGSFEYGLNLDWEYRITTGSAGQFSLATTQAMDGKMSLKTEVSTLKYSNGVSAKTRVKIGSDSLYLLHFWARGPEEAKLYVQIEGAQQTAVLYEMHTGATAFFYPFKVSNSKLNSEIVITFYFQDDKTKTKVADPCSVTTTAGATYFLDGLTLVDQSNTLGYDVHNTFLWNYNQKPNANGKVWTAGDNDVSFDLPDGRRMWFFNDSFYGVNYPARNRLVDVGQFVRNIVVVQDLSNKLTAYPVTNQGGQWAYFRIPDQDVIYNTDGSVKNIFWVGDALIEDNQVKVHLIEVYGNDRSYLAKFSYPELQFLGIEQQEDFCHTYETFFVENDKVYLYRTENEGVWGRYMHVARADLGDLNGKKGTWEYWNGNAWGTSRDASARLHDMMGDGVIRLGEGNYAHVSMPLMSPELHVAFAPAPQGPWTNRQLVAVGDRADKHWYYMPNFHGQLANGMYSISFSANYNYCLFFCKDCEVSSFVDKYWYRPRYVQIDLLGLSPYTKNPKDCAGVENGTAFFDNCGECVGGTTGLNPCITGVAKLYADANFSGASVGLNAGEYTLDSLQGLGFSPESLSSFTLESGYVIELYAADNFRNEVRIFENQISDLAAESFDNATYSLIVRRKGIADLTGTFAIQHKQSGMFMSISGNNTANDAPVILRNYQNSAFQKFTLTAVGNGTYAIKNTGSDKYLSIFNQSNEQKAYVNQWDGLEFDIIALGGEISAQYSDSPGGEDVTKLIDKNVATKFLTFHNSSWVQYKALSPKVLSRYSLTSANDAPVRDPRTWTLSGSNDGENWTVIDTQQDVTFSTRFQEKSFPLNTETGFSYYRIEMTCSSGTVLQLAELKLFAKTNSQSGFADSQLFVIQDAGNGFVKLINKNSDLQLEVIDGVTTAGEKVWQNLDFGQLGGQWKLVNPDSIPNSVESLQTNPDISIFPNPATDFVRIEARGQEIIRSVAITDLRGSVVFFMNCSDVSTVVPLTGLNTGFYLIKINTESGSYGHKLLNT